MAADRSLRPQARHSRPSTASTAPTAIPARGREPPRFVEGSPAFHRDHGRVDVLAVVGPQRLIRVQTGPGPSEIAVLAVHVGELSAASGPAEQEDLLG